MEQGRSRVFTGTRALGLVAGSAPLVARYVRRRRDTLLVTAAGRSLHTYSASGLRLLAVSKPHAEPIRTMAADSFLVYSAAGNSVFAWRRGAELQHEYRHEAPVSLMLPLAHQLLVVDESGALSVWYVKEETLYLKLDFDPTNFKISVLMHPSAYLNKILLCSEQGTLQLWNIKTSKMVYLFRGWGSSVTAAVQAPAVDVVAIGLADGKIILHNLKVDKTVMQFTQDWGLVTCISFRTDGHPIMVTGSSAGHLVMWNLEERRVASQIENAHNGPVANCVCFPNEPVFATNSSDNSLKLWIFDMSDGSARLLRIREGHSAPPYIVRYTGSDTKTLLSTGPDLSLRVLSSLSGTHSISLGRASYNRKASKKKKQSEDSFLMPPITEFSSSMQRDKQWDSIAAVHRGLNMVTTWSLDKKRMGNHKIVPENMSKDVTATCATVSHCGHFVFIGYNNGEVYKFNMQSGYERGRWGDNKAAHIGPIRGIETDNLNTRLITVGVDKRLRIWHFDESKVPMKVIKLDEIVSFTRCHRESGLLALCNEDYSIVLTDMDSNNIVRKYEGHTSKINDAIFSYDSRWLLTAAMDCTIRTWDIPTGQLIDIFQVESPCTSLTMSPSGDFIATTHVGQLGVYLWANRTLYVHVNLRPIDLNTISIPTLELPALVQDESQEVLEELETLNLNDESEFKSPEQISSELITLSNLSTSRWQNLLNLDVIKQRNKPKAPPKVPKAAPFFLPTISNLEVQFDLSDKSKDTGSKMLIPETFFNLTAFGKMVENASETDDYSECIEKIKSMGPSMIDFEMNNLSPENGGSVDVMNSFLKLLNSMLKSCKDFELAQAYLGLFLKTHGPAIVESDELRESIDEIEKSQSQGWEKLQESIFYNLCVVKSIKNM